MSAARLLPVALLLLAVAPVAGADGGSDAERQRWLDGPLYGGDNESAALRRVRIRADGAGYRIHIDNQFHFDCALEFSEAGHPVRLAQCVETLPPCAAGDPRCGSPMDFNRGWGVRESGIALECATLATEVVCNGDYTLTHGDAYEQPARLSIARRR